MHLRHLVGLLASSFAVLALGTTSACDSDGGGPAEPGAEAGVDATPSGPTEAKQIGVIQDAIQKTPLGGATVTIAGKSALTKDDGSYEIIVPRDKPYTMSVAAPEYYTLNEQQWIVKQESVNRAETSMLSVTIADLLASFLPPRDVAKGLLVVRVVPVPPCDSETGATLAIEPAGASKATYFAGGRPNKAATSATKDEAFSAAFSDVDIGVPIKVTVSSPLCEQLPFPVDYHDVTYTGMQTTEPGKVLSFIRVFIGPKKPADAGTD